MIIGLYSPAPRSGKTTVADHLCFKHGFQRVRFAGPLKAMATALFREMGFGSGAVREMVEGYMKDLPVPGFAFRPRDVMQTLGTDWGREALAKDLWVQIAHDRMLDHAEHGHRVVVDDLRFPNEYHMLRGLGAKLVRIVRPDVTGGDVGYEGQICTLEWDLTLANEWDIPTLHRDVDFLLTHWK